MADETRTDVAEMMTGTASAAQADPAADPLAGLAAAAPSLSFGEPEPEAVQEAPAPAQQEAPRRSRKRQYSHPKRSRWWMPLSSRSISPIHRPS